MSNHRSGLLRLAQACSGLLRLAYTYSATIKLLDKRSVGANSKLQRRKSMECLGFQERITYFDISASLIQPNSRIAYVECVMRHISPYILDQNSELYHPL
jgi:hypothetical protein